MRRGVLIYADDATSAAAACERVPAGERIALFARSDYDPPRAVDFYRVRATRDARADLAAAKVACPLVAWRVMETAPEVRVKGFAVVTCYYNFAGFDAPRRNLMRFLRDMDRAGVPVFGLEIVEGGATAMTADRANWKVVRVDPRYRLWQKEAAINAVVATLPTDVTAVAMIDADVSFDVPDWVEHSRSLLAEHPAVQPFDEAVWTDRTGRIELTRPAAATVPDAVNWRRHPGFAWVIRRDFWTRGPGLYPYCITGAGDVVLATGLACASSSALPGRRIGPKNVALAREWHAEVRRWISHRSVAAVPGRLWHEWHGDRADRRYEERHGVMAPIDVSTAVEMDADGLLRWAPAATPASREMLADFFAQRKEDG